MATNRIVKGWKLYKAWKVHLQEADHGHAYYEFTVEGSHGDVYSVYYNQGSWLCECQDWMNHVKDPGAWHCKHCEASHFKLAEKMKEDLR